MMSILVGGNASLYRFKMKRYFFLFLISLLVCQSCNQNNTDLSGAAADVSKNPISVSGMRFIDSFGRQVIFSGFNYVNKNPSENYLSHDSAEVFARMNSWGVNCLRLGIIWDGAEPEPGKFDEKYLDEIEKKVSWAAMHNIYVMLDMHQDLFSRKFSDGAPLWATLDENLPHQTGSVWSDAYLMSMAVQRSFDNFWDNKPAPDGVGIQDHYINLWKHIAKRFSGYKNVIGYDVMNEPFNGSNANLVMPAILTEYAKMLVEETGQAPPGEQELMMLWANEESRFEVLKKLATADKYSRIMDAAYPVNREFETTQLQSFYQRATDAIRTVDSTRIIFLEHGYFGNTGIRSSIEPVKGKSGLPDPLQAYAAHGYDLLVDTREYDNSSNERVEFIFTRILETSKRMNVPVLVGEWGGFSGESAGSILPARHILGIFEKSHFGNTYWAYGPGTSQSPGFKNGLLRPYPQFIAGSLISYSLNYDTGIFSCTWEENQTLKAPTVIYIPDITNLKPATIRFTPAQNKAFIQPIKNSVAGFLVVPVMGKGGTRSLEFNALTGQGQK
jgi:endoglycosylceramidase